VLGVIPTGDTFAHFGQLLNQAGLGIREMGIPVTDHEGLLFLTTMGIGLVAVTVDLCAVTLRRPAMAGLPMLAIYSVPVAVYVDSVPVLPFIVGAAGFLWLLVADNVDRVRRFGRRFTGDGRDVDVWEPSPLAAAGRRLAVIGVAVAVLLPLAVPGLTTGLLSRLTQVGGGSGAGGFGSGGNGRVNLFASLSGSLNQSDTRDMMKVTTSEQDPFYLRLGVADVINDNGFANRTPSGRSITRGFSDPREGPDRAGVSYQQHRAEVEILDLNMGLAPIYTTTIGVSDIGNGWSYDTGAQVLFSTRNTTKDKKYSFDYVRARYSPQALRTARPIERTDPLAVLTTVPDDVVVDA
jgi:TgpA N-terminal domain